jgi:hypothetical protein
MNGFATIHDLWCTDPRHTTVDLRDTVAGNIIEHPRMPLAVNDCNSDPNKPAGWPKSQAISSC